MPPNPARILSSYKRRIFLAIAGKDYVAVATDGQNWCGTKQVLLEHEHNFLIINTIARSVAEPRQMVVAQLRV
jgi:hypothetical protein